MKNDRPVHDLFAQIATQRLAQRSSDLIEPKPLSVPKCVLPLDRKAGTSAFRPPRKMNTPDQLQSKLSQMRKRYAKYMQDIAPKLKSPRMTLPLDSFDWRQETEADQRDFASHTLKGKGAWQQVVIPHFGPPLGKAVTYYRKTFKVTQKMMRAGSLWTCFDGVDYKAHVFVNGTYIGSHEGFFAPFEFEFTDYAQLGENTLLVKVENDAPTIGMNNYGSPIDGDKIYAVTGLGYDDPEYGWHHCPPGMGINQPARIEARSRRFIRDLFVRPLPDKEQAEVWVEVYNCDTGFCDIEFNLSLFGQNFKKTVFRDRSHHPQTTQIRGHGDVDQYTAPCVDQPIGGGVNYYRIPITLPKARLWALENPWLYQLQISLIDDGKEVDTAKQQFGMRSFRQDETTKPKGKFYLNDQEIRLRGSNTMGHMQQCVFRDDLDQLIDDILLAKISNMNFLRLTQRPVQKVIYDYCDRLGLMTQTDLPLFGKLRRNQMLEAVRQAEDMERLIRPHACAVIVSYINEPYPNATGKPHRHLVREELDTFFELATKVIHQSNPDRVVKCCDGDYDPPAPFGMPDNHCYCGWYIGHGLDLGKLHRGYWIPVEKNWYYGCGEFGSEGLDFRNTMEKYYPKSWLPKKGTAGQHWSPGVISKAQSERFHYLWYETPQGCDDWVDKSHDFQAWITKLMTEAFRRDRRMNTFAIHLFIDAWPAGWMKTIMDTQRQPKKAYFAYRDALSPLLVSLRTDRWGYQAGEKVELEAWVCNDTHEVPKGAKLHYQLEVGGRVIQSGQCNADVQTCDSTAQGLIQFSAPQVDGRTEAKVRLALLDQSGKVICDNELEVVIYPLLSDAGNRRVRVLGQRSGQAATLVRQLGSKPVYTGAINSNDVIVGDDPVIWKKHQTEIDQAVRQGATAVLLDLPVGTHPIASDNIAIVEGGMGKRHFVSRDTGHHLVEGFQPNEFRFWYDSSVGYATPLLETVIDPAVNGWAMILQSGNGSWQTDWRPVPAAIEKNVGEGVYRICQVKLAHRTEHNPVALRFARRLLNLDLADVSS